MSMIKNAQLEALKVVVAMEFAKGMLEAESQYDRISTTIPSTASQNIYAWLSKFPRLKLWTGTRVIESMKENGYTLVNQKFEATFGISVDDLDDNNIGHYSEIARAYGREVVDFKNRKVFSKLNAGFADVCYDGQFFFDTDHPVNAKTDGSGADSSVSNLIDGVEAPWYLMRTKTGLSPIILQERQKAQLNQKMNADGSDHVFMEDEYLMGIKWRGATGYGFWQTAVAGKVALEKASFNEAFEMMAGFKAHGGDALGVSPDTLVVGVSNRAAGTEQVEVMNHAGGASNSNYKAVDLLVVPWLP